MLTHRLRVVGRAGAGTDHVDLAAAARHGVTVAHTPGSNATAVAEFALTQLLAVTRSFSPHNKALYDGSWSAPAVPAMELSELTLGIAGLGRIGLALALAERGTALGMEVQAVATRPAGAWVPRARSLTDLLVST